jgi:hypothetical protein
MQRRMFLYLDVVFFLALPLLMWETTRNILGDFQTILYSSFTGVIYSLYRYYKMKEINFTCLFMIINLLAGTLLDVFSGSAIRLLWNSSLYSLGLSFIYIVSVLLNKPLFLLFAFDIMIMEGQDRRITKELLYEATPLKVFKMITFANSIRKPCLPVS